MHSQEPFDAMGGEAQARGDESAGEEPGGEGSALLDAEPALWAEEAERLAAEQSSRDAHPESGGLGENSGESNSGGARASAGGAKAKAVRPASPASPAASSTAAGGEPARKIRAKKPSRSATTILVPPWGAGSPGASAIATLPAALAAPAASSAKGANAPVKAREKKAWKPLGDLSKLTRAKPEDPVRTAGAEWARRLADGNCQGLGKALSRMPQLAQWTDERGWSLAHWAAWGAPKAALRLLQKAGADWEAAHSGAETPLIVACRRGRPQIVLALLDLGAEAKKTGLHGQSAIELLSHAFAQGSAEQVGDVVQAVARLRDGGSNIALPLAVPRPGQEKELPHRGLVARVLGDGFGRDMSDLAEALIEMGERPSEEDLNWAHRRGSSEGVARAKAALERALLQEEAHSRTAESRQPRMLGAGPAGCAPTAPGERRRSAKRI